MKRTLRTTYHVPVKTVSEANRREHWAKRHKRTNMQRYIAKIFTCIEMSSQYGAVIRIKLVRYAPRELDSDNVCSALKAVRDGVADGLAINDGDKRIVWIYDQFVSKTYGVDVEVTRRLLNQEATR